MHIYRNKNCNELRLGDVGKTVKLAGWVHRIRDHGKLLFIDLRDHYGVTQVVFEDGSEQFGIISGVRNESVISVEGLVIKRDDESKNNNIDTGDIELYVKNVVVHSIADPVPFEINNERELSDELRLKYRFLDLRRPTMHKRVSLRSDVIKYIRDVMHEMKFTEVTTPILTASSPEGARDYLVPSRLHKGCFYALPQAPQQFKQLLMMSSFDRYFQIAPCFRDEDARADRAPGEFYQLDMEMAFVTEDDVMSTAEIIIHKVFSKFGSYPVADLPFPRIKFSDAKKMYGSDKPDLRNPLKSFDVSDIFVKSEFSTFKKNIADGLVVRAIRLPRCASMPRSFFDKKIDAVKEIGGSGMAYIIVEDGSHKGPIAKFVSTDLINEMCNRLSVQPNDVIIFSCEPSEKSDAIISFLISSIGRELNLINESSYKFCWITDFPFYERNDDGNLDFCHNPFSMPRGGMKVLEKDVDPLSITGIQYDIVCNGIELSSGAIRNHIPELFYKMFEKVGYNKEDVDKKFSAIVTGLRYGPPPHGGIAPGIDRMLMLLMNTENIRDVICFPMNQKNQDTMMNAPSNVSEEHLKLLSIRTIK